MRTYWFGYRYRKVFLSKTPTPKLFVSASEMMDAGANPTQISREFFQSRSLASMKLESIVIDRMELLRRRFRLFVFG